MPHVQQNTKTTFSSKKIARNKAQDPRNILKGCMDVSCNSHQHCLWQTCKITTHLQEGKKCHIFKKVPLTHDAPLPKYWAKYIIDKHPKVFYKCRHTATYILNTTVNISCSYYYILVAFSACSTDSIL